MCYSECYLHKLNMHIHIGNGETTKLHIGLSITFHLMLGIQEETLPVWIKLKKKTQLLTSHMHYSLKRDPALIYDLLY